MKPHVREPRLADIVPVEDRNIVHAQHGYRPATWVGVGSSRSPQPDIVPNTAKPATKQQLGNKATIPIVKTRAPHVREPRRADIVPHKATI